MNDNNKYPATLEEIKQDIIFRRGTKYRLNELRLITEESAILCMDELAERYEQRIAELESALKTIKELGQNPNDSNCLLAAQIANNLLS